MNICNLENQIHSGGWWVSDPQTLEAASDMAKDVLGAANTIGLSVMRDSIIGVRGEVCDLVAQDGDFWFHTDGVFLSTPPRWVMILVLEADWGGASHVLDLTPLATQFGDIRIEYGRLGNALESPFWERASTQPAGCFRYRRDMMSALDKDADCQLTALHYAIEDNAADRAIDLGCLKPGQIQIVDNWRMAHRREKFEGRRVIRRIWLA